MNIEKINDNLVLLSAADGLVLTDGETFATAVAVPSEAESARWREVPAESAQAEQSDNDNA